MKNGLAEVGEMVRYNGKFEYAHEFTQGLMQKYLKPGMLYKVVKVESDNLYQLEDFYWYPIESFDVNNRMNLTKKYNLK